MSSRAFRSMGIFTLAYTLAVIVWGAFVRATHSGAGCGDHWPTCNGEVIPFRPSVETLIEYTHRLTSGLALLIVVILAVWAYRTHPKGHAVRKTAVASVVFMLLEAALGAGLVLLELVATDASVRRALAMSLHLINTFLLLSAISACVFYAWVGDAPIVWKGKTARMVRMAQGVLLAVGASGAVAALGDTLVQAQVSSPLVTTLVQLRIWHPFLAILGVLTTSVAASALYRFEPRSLPAVRALAALLVSQLLVGVLNVALRAPVWIQLVHLLLADMVWIALGFSGRMALWGHGQGSAFTPAARLSSVLENQAA